MVLLAQSRTSCELYIFSSESDRTVHERSLPFSSFITILIDRVGRRRPLLFGSGTFIITFSILAAIVASFPPLADGSNANLAAERAGIAMIFLTSIVFSLSYGPVSWVLASEVFPTKTRSIGTSVATCCNWAFNVLFSQTSPIAMTNVKWRFYILFVVLNAVTFLCVFAFFPETKGEQLSCIISSALFDCNAQASPWNKWLRSSETKSTPPKSLLSVARKCLQDIMYMMKRLIMNRLIIRISSALTIPS